jgi:protein-S-isoprenylcysteine O-methyltransferase Ste14
VRVFHNETLLAYIVRSGNKILIEPLHGGEEHLSKDQAIGGTIFGVCLIVGIVYTLGLFYFGNPLESWSVAFWLIAIPVFLAFIAILAIGAWIGWTMATTPSPKPIEETSEKKEIEQGKQSEE